MLTRNPELPKKSADYAKIIRLFFRNKDVHNYNTKKLRKLYQNGTPIAKIIGDHGGDKKAQRALPEKAWGLKPVVYLAQGAKVMLRINILQKFGLVNGAQGTVVDILYDKSCYTEHGLPKCVIVNFPGYQGPALFKDHPTYVPIVPFEARWIDFKQRFRNQLPLDLAFAITIHKSQGLTLERAVIDLGKSENQGGGITFVALSRLKTFEGLFLKPMQWQRLNQINNKVMIKQRIREQKRLRKLQRNT